MDKTYQEWCIDTIYSIMRDKNKYRGNVIDQGYIYPLKGIIDHYSSMYYTESPLQRNMEKKHINIWWDHINRTNQKKLFGAVLMSSDAKKKVKKSMEEQGNPKDLKKDLRFEHITPKGVTFHRLIEMDFTDISENDAKKAIESLFEYSKLVLLTQKESNLLDGAGRIFEKKHLEYMKGALIALIDLHKMTKRKYKEEMGEAERLLGKSLKANGSGVARMCYLSKEGKSFCYFDSEDKCETKEWYDYLIDKTWVIE